MLKDALRPVSHAPSRPSTMKRRGPRSLFTRSRLALVGCVFAAAAAVGACSPPSGSGLGNQAVAIAQQQLGKPYVYGAAGPNAFDCSGLTQYVYARLGRYLARSADAQYHSVPLVPQYAAQPGDLIFFLSGNTAYHVGIYVGNNTIIHAPHTGTVVQYTPIWTTAYAVGRVY